MPVPVDDRIVLSRLWIDPILGVYDARRLGRRAGCQHFRAVAIVAVVVLTAVVVARRIRSRLAPALGGHCPARLTYAVLAVWLVYAVVRLITEL